MGHFPTKQLVAQIDLHLMIFLVVDFLLLGILVNGYQVGIIFQSNPVNTETL